METIIILRRILFFDHTAVYSGGEIALFNLARALDRGSFVPVVVVGGEGPLVDRLRDAGVETHVYPLPRELGSVRKGTLHLAGLLRVKQILKSVLYAWSLARLIRSLRADLIHTNSLKADIIGGIAGRLAGVPVIWHVRDRIASDYLPMPAVVLFRWLSRVIPTRVVANSRATAVTLTPGKADVVYSGITGARVVYDGIPRSMTRPDILPGRGPARCVGIVGRLTRWKGQHVFLEAAQRVHAARKDVGFLIVGAALFGEDDYDQELHALTRALQIEDVVEFTGFQSDVAGAVGRMDILVHASIIGEPFGQVVIEGMAAGKPVVATNGGGVPEIVVDGATGILVRMNDPDAMAEAILRLLDDPEAATQMGIRGRERVLEKFTIERTAEQVQQVYRQILDD